MGIFGFVSQALQLLPVYLHNKTGVALANLWWNICINHIEHRTFPYSLIVIRSVIFLDFLKWFIRPLAIGSTTNHKGKHTLLIECKVVLISIERHSPIPLHISLYDVCSLILTKLYTVAYKHLRACTGEYLIILEKWCSSSPKWIFLNRFFRKINTHKFDFHPEYVHFSWPFYTVCIKDWWLLLHLAFPNVHLTSLISLGGESYWQVWLWFRVVCGESERLWRSISF